MKILKFETIKKRDCCCAENSGRDFFSRFDLSIIESVGRALSVCLLILNLAKLIVTILSFILVLRGERETPGTDTD
jgi:hypothetical protein